MKTFEAEKLRDLVAFCEEHGLEVLLESLLETGGAITFHGYIRIAKRPDQKEKC